MKKVSVFTVLTCFLATTANFSCYAGNFFSSDEKKSNDSKTPPVKPSSKPEVRKDPAASAHPPSLPVEQKSGQDASSHSKPNPSPSLPPFDPVVIELRSGDLDPELLAKTPASFDDLTDQPTPKPLGHDQVQQLADDVRKTLGRDVIVNVYVSPSASSDQSPLSLPPSTLPASLPEVLAQKSLDDSHQSPLGSDDRRSSPTQLRSQIPSAYPTPYYPPQEHSQIPPSVPSSSSNHWGTYEVAEGILTLPVAMQLFPKPDAPGQVALVPKVCALSFYNYLSELDGFESKMRGKMILLTAKNKDDILNLIKTYLERHGKRNGQIFTAQKIFEGLKKAIETPNERKITFKVAPVEGKAEVYFCLEAEGGVIIFGKVPGQDF